MSHTLPSISMTLPPLLDDRATSPLPPIGHDISRPASTSTNSERRGSPPGQEQVGERVTLPSLSTLANVASQDNLGQSQPTTNNSQHMQNFSNASPTPTSVAGQGNVPPVCQNCQTKTTPLWRRDEAGLVLCNACGLFLKLHGRPRPISLKTDVIKSRNRVKSSAQNGRRKMQFGPHQPGGHHPNMSTPPPHLSYRRVSDQHMTAYSDRSASPISRAGTPASLHPHHTHPGHHPQSAPSLSHHVFDPTLARSPSPLPLPNGAYHQSHSAPSTILHRATSPYPNGPTLPLPVPTITHHAHSPSPVSSRPTPPQMAEMHTRISELEVINALYKGQLQEMQEARRQDGEAMAHLRKELDHFRARALQAEQRLEAQQHQAAQHQQPEPLGESQRVNYASATGSVKRRRGRTLEKAAEDAKTFGSKRRETGEYPTPEPAVLSG